ncbi:MAG TPA: twin-arginine translocase TatA/TatE family subunit [Candidatus Aquicultor sp.]|jgi:sec-independent protein translocase protein TatA
MFGLGYTELIIILVIVLIIFGPKKLPDLGKAVGQSIRELRKAQDGKEDVKEASEQKSDKAADA